LNSVTAYSYHANANTGDQPNQSQNPSLALRLRRNASALAQGINRVQPHLSSRVKRKTVKWVVDQKGHSACPVHIAIVKDLAAMDPEQEAASSASSDVSLIKISSFWSNAVFSSVISFFLGFR
jgi:hypothetical protein